MLIWVKSCQSAVKSGNDPRARGAKVEAVCIRFVRCELFRLREHHLPHIDISRQESGLAISEIVFPQPPEPVVESKRHQARPGCAEIISPGRERRGIILPEKTFANDGPGHLEATGPGDIFGQAAPSASDLQ